MDGSKLASITLPSLEELRPFMSIRILTTVTVRTVVNDPRNREKMTSPIRNQTIANTLAGMDWGQRSPYLFKIDQLTLLSSLYYIIHLNRFFFT